MNRLTRLKPSIKIRAEIKIKKAFRKGFSVLMIGSMMFAGAPALNVPPATAEAGLIGQVEQNALLLKNAAVSEVPANAAASGTPERASKAVSPGVQIVVGLAPGVSASDVARKVQAEITRRGPRHYATLAFLGSVSKVDALQKVKSIPGVLSAEEKQRYRLSGITVSDTHYSSQWSLAKTNVPQAWESGALGKGITIAIVDTGVDLTHPDLQKNLVPGYNAITQSEESGANRDNNGHGTHVAGIAAAALNGAGIVGVAPEAKIMPIKTMDQGGEGYDDVIADGIYWAVDHGANIVNLSIGSDEETQVLKDAVSYAVSKGVILVAASGNYDPTLEDNPGVEYPAADPDVIAVTASDQYNRIADFSDTGPEADVAAPGSNIVSDWRGGGYAEASGTSMAAPFVAGEAALIWSQHPDWKREEVIKTLESAVLDLGPQGRDDAYGFGLVDVGLAIRLDAPLKTLFSPANVNSEGAVVSGGNERTGAELKIPAQTLDRGASVMLQAADLPAPLPDGVSALSSPIYLDWPDLKLSHMLMFTLKDAAITGSAVLYRWNGERWLAVGGATQNGQIRLGIFIPGIYVAGTSTQADPERLAGIDEVQTSVNISQQAYPEGADAVILARSNNFPDALAGAPLAAKLQAPILLTPTAALTPDVISEISRLKPKTVYLLGGIYALSSEIETELKKNYSVERIYGETAYGTAAAIAQKLGTKGKAVVASGSVFADALVAASWASQEGMPILLSSSGALPPETDQALREFSVTRTVIIGGEAVVGGDVAAQLPNPERLSGYTKYDTAAAVLAAYPPQSRNLYLATGERYPDALTGAALAAPRGSMIVLAPPAGNLPPALISTLSTLSGRTVTALGGAVALPESTVKSVRSLVQ